MKLKKVTALLTATMVAFSLAAGGNGSTVYALEPDIAAEEPATADPVENTDTEAPLKTDDTEKPQEAEDTEKPQEAEDAKDSVEIAEVFTDSDTKAPAILSSGEVAIDETHFPDSAFLEYVKTTFDTDKNGILSEAEGSSLNGTLYVPKGVADLAGIEYFPNLKKVSAGKTSSLERADLSKNTELTEVNISKVATFKYLNVTGNQKLQTLICNVGQLTSLDVSTNTALTKLDCAGNQISSLKVGTLSNLTYLQCSQNPLTELDVTKNLELTSLYCSETALTSLDISQNSNLKSLSCGNTKLAQLDTKSNPQLSLLNCNGCTFDLDVSSNQALQKLYCDSMNLTSLDISKNTALDYLSCEKNNLTSLDISGHSALTYLLVGGNKLFDVKGIGANQYLYLGTAINPSTQRHTLAVNSDSIDMTTVYPDFDPSKICVDRKLKGATLEGTVFKDLKPGTEVTYDYNTGNRLSKNDHNPCLDVRIKILSQNSWQTEPSIADWTYGETPSTPTAQSAFGDVSYLYSNSPGGEFSDTVPTEAGTYYLKASVSEGNDYSKLESIVSFTINKAENSWVEEPSITDWTYGETPSTPAAESAFGDVSYLYSDSPDGEFSDTVPTEAGTYYLKASVSEGDNYSALESIVSFTIKEAQNSWVEEPAIADWTEGQTPSSPAGKAANGKVVFTYSDSENGEFTTSAPLKTGTYYMKATVEYPNYKTLEKVVSFKILKKADTNNSSDKPNTPPKGNDTVSGKVQTGDASSAGTWTTLLVTFGCGLLLLRSRRRKEDY